MMRDVEASDRVLKTATLLFDESSDGNDKGIDNDATMMIGDNDVFPLCRFANDGY